MGSSLSTAWKLLSLVHDIHYSRHDQSEFRRTQDLCEDLTSSTPNYSRVLTKFIGVLVRHQRFYASRRYSRKNQVTMSPKLCFCSTMVLAFIGETETNRKALNLPSVFAEIKLSITVCRDRPMASQHRQKQPMSSTFPAKAWSTSPPRFGPLWFRIHDWPPDIHILPLWTCQCCMNDFM